MVESRGEVECIGMACGGVEKWSGVTCRGVERCDVLTCDDLESRNGL